MLTAVKSQDVFKVKRNIQGFLFAKRVTKLKQHNQFSSDSSVDGNDSLSELHKL
jgi:hypothetical protein